ncbi:MAG: Fe-S cluster assembly protein NifU [Candidatus Tritonobacter lacicola]|nr:Fe-S cluster assembly protein NifU [Candidatus Tritonobacter lacicola]
MWDYSDKLKDHFFNPRNVGEMPDADGVGEVGSMACGDSLRIYFKLDENGRIKDAKFLTFGCGSAIASASVLTEMIKGKTLEEVEKVTNQDIVDYLGGMPVEKLHCSVMGREALEAAIADYRGGKPKAEEGKIVCNCFGVTDREIERVARENNLRSVEDVTHYTKAGGGCGSCHAEIERILARVWGEKEAGLVREKAKKLTNIQRMKLIEETMEREIRPALRADGGDIELVDIYGTKVIVALRGTCTHCPSAEFTLKEYVEKKLREQVDEEIVLEEVKI